jgi:hypothetical protein
LQLSGQKGLQEFRKELRGECFCFHVAL